MVRSWATGLTDADTRSATVRASALETFLRYHYQQGLSKRLLTSEDIFVPELLDT
jgi:hypothetical protein